MLYIYIFNGICEAEVGPYSNHKEINYFILVVRPERLYACAALVNIIKFNKDGISLEQ